METVIKLCEIDESNNPTGRYIPVPSTLPFFDQWPGGKLAKDIGYLAVDAKLFSELESILNDRHPDHPIPPTA